VTEVACASEEEHNAMFICCGNDFLVTNTAPWLDNDMNPSGCQHIEPITEREKSITCRYPTNGSGPCAFTCQPRCIETVLLAPANAHCFIILRNHNGIRAHCSTYLPCEAGLL
jgi:hypothetical protein